MNFLKAKWKREEPSGEEYARAALLDRIAARLAFLSETELRVHADHLAAEDYPAFFAQLFLQLEALAEEERSREAQTLPASLQTQLADLERLAEDRRAEIERLANDAGVKEDELAALQGSLLAVQESLRGLKADTERCSLELLTETLRCKVGLRKMLAQRRPRSVPASTPRS